MKTDKEVKQEFKKKAGKEFEKYYPVKALREKGFFRNTCKNCGTVFWAMEEKRRVCGNSACIGGYEFIGRPNTKKQFDYLQAWEEFRKFFKKLGYLEYRRYPVVARWREDVYWVGASVYPFQPYVVSGEIKPKSNAVIIPQLSLRFNDIDNVGITGSHYVCFDMLGQLHFEKKENYEQEKYWEEYFNWINKGMTVPAEEIILHEDAWAGGGNFGPCMEFFSRGMEIGNQVYMMFKQEEQGYSELNIKVLDMGQGHERVPWFTTGKSNSYETTFPTVSKKLYSITGHKPDEKLMQKFLPYSALLNVDEVEDVRKVWKKIADEIKVDEKELKEKILSLAAVYSIGEHSRATLVALHDGALPSNVGGGYNLRTIMRRMFGFAEQYGWKVDFAGLMELHARFLKPIYPELSDELGDVNAILDNEEKKFRETRQRAKQTIERVLKEKISTEKLIELYDSHGISPGQVVEEAKKVKLQVKAPDNFYALVSERHEKKEMQIATKKEESIDVSGLPATEKLYWKDWKLLDFEAIVMNSFENFVVLDKTAFYPTSGGQLHDIGIVFGANSDEKANVIEVFKEKEVIVHRLSQKSKFKAGEKVKGIIDFERRKQLMQHHTSAHLVNAVAKMALGNHVWQAGAAKTPEKGRLDITHYELLSEEQLKNIEKKVNELIEKGLPVNKEILPREQAEEKYGMEIYQGGFIPGRMLRIVSISNIDREACGGTHANSTKELEKIKILNSTKVQDGVIRINYVSGKAAEKTETEKTGILEETAKIMNVSPEQVPERAREIFEAWKKARKGKIPELKPAAIVEKRVLSKEELLQETARILSTQPEHVPKTIARFLREIEEVKKHIKK